MSGRPTGRAPTVWSSQRFACTGAPCRGGRVLAGRVRVRRRHDGHRPADPLYAIYQRQWHFSSGVLTLIFAVYAVAVLATLLLAGQASDQAGRKPVLAAALGFSVASTVVFIFAASPG